MPVSGPLAGRVALVTGAGWGLGAAHARTLAAAGAAVLVRVVNTISEAALKTGHHVGPAYAAKAALWGLTMALADEGSRDGSTVNAVSPGARTRMSRDHLAGSGSRLDLTPEHVSRVVLALVSESAGDVTGRVVHAAGGEVREYRLTRMADTALVDRLSVAVRGGAAGL